VTQTGQIIASDASTGAPSAPALSEEAAGFTPVDLYQRREKIFTRSIQGRFQRIRLYSGWPLLLGYLLLPWINWGDRQSVLFDLPSRQFHILGLTFWPQDFMLLAWLLIISAFALFTFTSVVGRVWCGYTCPQTVWTAIFMWVEQITEGPRHARIRLDHAPWNFEKIRKRGLKHAMWLGWAFITGLTFIGYFTPIRQLAVDFATFDVGGWALLWTVFFTAATYINAGWLREQVCIYMCPYARFQSAMFDKDTLIVSYDGARGEPRGARKRGTRPDSLGDCIDCELCVQVCPTGIDIRNGLQYQCIGCAHCIDACDDVMKKVGYAPGLIRYTTENALEGQPSRVLRPRVVGYATALLIMTVAFTIALFNRSLLGIDVIRERGDLYHVHAGVIRNDYALKVINKHQSSQQFSLTVTTPSGITLQSDGPSAIDIAAGEVLNVPFSLSTGLTALERPYFEIEFHLCDAAGRCDSERSRFFGPTGT